MKIKNSLLTKKEQGLVHSGSAANVKLHSITKLKKFIFLSKTLRDKCLDLVDRKGGGYKHKVNGDNIKKAHIFNAVLGRFQSRYEDCCDRVKWEKTFF